MHPASSFEESSLGHIWVGSLNFRCAKLKVNDEESPVMNCEGLNRLHHHHHSVNVGCSITFTFHLVIRSERRVIQSRRARDFKLFIKYTYHLIWPRWPRRFAQSPIHWLVSRRRREGSSSSIESRNGIVYFMHSFPIRNGCITHLAV